MYESYEKQYPIDTEGVDINEQKALPLSPYYPYLPGTRPYIDFFQPWLIAYDYTDWRDETLSWQLTCSFAFNLNPSPIVRVKGPDAVKFFKKYFVNNFDKFPVGSSKHGIMCLDNGIVAAQGVLMRLGEDEFEAHWLSPYLDFCFAKQKYNAIIEDLSGKRFLFQLGGPRSLEIIEDATGDDLHDLKFVHFRDSSINGKIVRILRFGMSGGLGYEVHGNMEDSRDIFMKIIEAGKPYGMRRLGIRSYLMNHTPGGSQQGGMHFVPAAFMDADFAKLAAQNQKSLDTGKSGLNQAIRFTGSVGEDVIKRCVNPIELGLEKIIDYSKEDFVGKAALEAYKTNPKRNIVTLKWNAEDIGDVYASQYRDGEPYCPMDEASQTVVNIQGSAADLVLDKDGKEIGISSGRAASYFHRAMLSLAIIDLKYAKLGTEVIVLWGDTGTHQKKIRATVAPFPFNTNIANRTFDVETIPHPANRKK
jgi:glycine cleavage system aminomethyltransferase T